MTVRVPITQERRHNDAPNRQAQSIQHRRVDYATIPLTQIRVSPHNVRKVTDTPEDETTISDLALDIQRNGLLNPITVRRTRDDSFEVIAGQRRFFACQQLGEHSVSCSIVSVDDEAAAELSLVENLQRADMTAKDKTAALAALFKRLGSFEEVSKTIHMSIATVKKYVEIAKLDTEILDLIDKKGDERISLEVANRLSKLAPELDKHAALDATRNLPVRARSEVLSEMIRTNVHDVSHVQALVSRKEIELSRSVPTGPFVYDADGTTCILIPQVLQPVVAQMVKSHRERKGQTGQVLWCLSGDVVDPPPLPNEYVGAYKARIGDSVGATPSSLMMLDGTRTLHDEDLLHNAKCPTLLRLS